MLKTICLIFTLILLVIHNGSAATDDKESKIYDPIATKIVSQSILKLAHDITEKEFQSRVDIKSQIISPISIAATLSLVLLGAKGKTYDELLNLLGLSHEQMLKVPMEDIHQEFGNILDDLTNDLPNSNRIRPVVPWRTKPYVKEQKPHRGTRPTKPFITFNTDDVNTSTLPSLVRKRRAENDENVVEHKIFIANAIFLQNEYNLRSDYETVVKSNYKSDLKRVDFKNNGKEAIQEINDWVSLNTNGKIQNIIDSPPVADTKAILANALYFKALWDKTFIDGGTSRKDFYPDGLSGRSIQVDMMAHGNTFPFYESEEHDCRILGVPYKKNLTTMYIILPNDSNGDKLRQLQANLTDEIINEMIDQMVLKTTILLFPKMHMVSKVELSKTLKTLGVNSLFDPVESDLSLISTGTENENDEETRTDNVTVALNNLEQLREKSIQNPGLYVDQVLHQVDLTINEKGTEGGAATAVILVKTGTDVVFRTETPFMLMIRHDETKVPLFYGAVFEPENDL